MWLIVRIRSVLDICFFFTTGTQKRARKTYVGWVLLTLRYSKHVSGGIAKAFGLDDGPAHMQAAIVKGRALGDATQALNT